MVLLPVSFRNWSLKTLALARASLMVIKKCQKHLGSTSGVALPTIAAPKLKHETVFRSYPCLAMQQLVLAINQSLASPVSPKMGVQGSSTNMDFSLIDISALQ
ncbi:hypothetical protein V8G54_016220 [Vigna mungo]|uniref:Uncharacterized protein n=1 Tax=Vigna mungo TaxID=3915 RepID=A0AAQ3NKS8_VIGMU